MGNVIGTFLAIIFIELIVALPIYYISKKIIKKNTLNIAFLIAITIGSIAGWSAGYRYKKDIIAEHAMNIAMNSKHVSGRELTKAEILSFYEKIMSSPELKEDIYLTATKLSSISTLPVILLLALIRKRNNKKLNADT